MNIVEVHGGMECTALCHLANEVQKPFHFTQESRHGSIPLRLTEEFSNLPLEVDLLHGVRVHTYQSKGICAYAGISLEQYLLCWSMLGLVQWRALSLNPLLRHEDFLHGQTSKCMYASQLFMEDYALVFDMPHLCNSCLRFYGELCPKSEMESLITTLTMRNAHSGQIPQMNA